MIKNDRRRYALGGSQFTSGSGKSNETGFYLILTNSNQKHQEFMTKNYRDVVATSSDRPFLIYGLWTLINIISVFTILSPLNPASLFTKLILLISEMPLSLMMLTLIWTVIKMKTGSQNALEWHACEHKTFVLLRSDLDPTIKNLKQCPPDNIWCGGSYIMTVLEIYLSSWILILLITTFPKSSLANLISLALLIFIASAHILFFLITSTPLLKSKLLLPITITLAKPAAILPLAMQRFFTTKEPSNEKLQETIETLRRFILTSKL